MSKTLFIAVVALALSGCVPGPVVNKGVTGSDLRIAYDTCVGHDDRVSGVTRQQAFVIRLSCTEAVYGGSHE